MRCNKILHWKGQQVSLICFSLRITLNKQLSSQFTKTRVITLVLNWEQSLTWWRAGVSGEVPRNEGGSSCQEEKGLSPPKLCPTFLSVLAAHGSVLNCNWVSSLYLFLLINNTIVKGNTISFPEQWYASQFYAPQQNMPPQILYMIFKFVFPNSLYNVQL